MVLPTINPTIFTIFPFIFNLASAETIFPLSLVKLSADIVCNNKSSIKGFFIKSVKLSLFLLVK